jgi:hypothetical protein
MSGWRSTRSILFVGALLASQACATLPRVAMTTQCGSKWTPAVRIHAVDSRGQIVPYVDVNVFSDDRAIYKTWTSSLGEARFALQPGSYRISVGQDGQWRYAIRSFTVPRDCEVEMRAQLTKHEIFPLDGPLFRSTR